MTGVEAKKELRRSADPEKANILQRFFKTGKGEYGDGDKFIGATMPKIRNIAKKFSEMAISETEKLLHSDIHEERMLALCILIRQFQRADEGSRKKIFYFYLKNTEHINSWDLVDLSAPNIAGVYLADKDRKIIYKLAKSKVLWERRIAILSTFAFLRKGDCEDTFKVSEMLLDDKEDLIQKAIGWMLREVGKRCSIQAEKEFLKTHSAKISRIALRYAIERFPNNEKIRFMKMKPQNFRILKKPNQTL